MAVGSGVPYNAYTGNGVTTVFAYGFTLLNEDDLLVTVDGTVTSSYTVSGVGVAAGGSITFSSAPANGAAVLLQRVIQLVRDAEYQTNGDLQAETINFDFDRLWTVVQNLRFDAARGVRVPEIVGIESLPSAVDRANKLLGFDADGNLLLVVPASQDASDLAISLAAESRSTRFVAGTAILVAPATRDAFVVGRNLTGLTNCHAFADRTIMDGVTDSGTYGVFDATTKLRGSHTQNHVFAYQDRVAYQGSGTLTETASLYSAPVHSGAGVITSRYGVSVYDCVPSGGGSINAQIGVFVRNLTGASSNVGLNIAQVAGYAIFANGGAKSRHMGPFGIGDDPAAGTKLYVDGGTVGSETAIYVEKTGGWSFYNPGNGKLYNFGEVGFGPQQNGSSVAFTVSGEATGPLAYVDTTVSQAFFGATGGDYPLGFVANGSVRLEVTASASSYAVQPGADNSQPLGASGKRWSVVYAGTGTINTSDAREKEQVRDLSAAERAVAVRCKALLRAFKFTSSVAEKGDGARVHFGVMAQDVAAAFAAEGLDASKYALYCYDQYPATFDTNGIQLTPAGDRYGIRYDELMAFMLAAM